MILLTMPFSDDYDREIINRLTVDTLLDSVDGMHRDLIELWMSGAYTLKQIGVILGDLYFEGVPIKPPSVRYYRDRILSKWRKIHTR